MRRIPPQDSHKPFAGRATRTASTSKAQAVLKGETKNKRDSGNSRCAQMLGSKGGSTPNARKFQPNQVVWALGPHRPRFVLVAPYRQPTPATNPQIKVRSRARVPVASQSESGARGAGVYLQRERAVGGTPGLPRRRRCPGPAPAPPPAAQVSTGPTHTLRAAPRGARVLSGAGDKTTSL